MVIDSLTKELASPSQIHTYAKMYMEARHARLAHENQRRDWIEKRLKDIDKENVRLVDLMVSGAADTETLGAKSKELGRERDDLRIELASLPKGSNIVVHPAAITRFAENLTKSRDYLHIAKAKLEMTLHMLDDLGELQGLIRDVIRSVTLSKDTDGVICIYVESYLEPFLSEPGATKKGAMPSGGHTVGSGGGT